MNVHEIAAFAACSLLAVLAIFQLALILGAPLGKYAWGGAHAVLPVKLRVGSLISIILYGIFAAIILSKAGLIDIIGRESIVNIGIWMLTVYFGTGVVLNGISRSKAERNVMTPVALVLAVCCLLVAIN